MKFPATNEANLAVATAFDLYRREVLYYRDIAPRSKAWTPTIYFADIADDGVDFLLVMEDLSHYRLGDQVEGCAIDDARAGVDWLGRQHASFWDAVDDPTLEFLPYVAPSYSSQALTEGCRVGWRRVRGRSARARARPEGDLSRRAARPVRVDVHATSDRDPWRLPHGQPVLRWRR